MGVDERLINAAKAPYHSHTDPPAGATKGSVGARAQLGNCRDFCFAAVASAIWGCSCTEPQQESFACT